MKNAIVFLVVAMLSVGCSSLNGPVPSIEPAGKGMSQASVNFSFEKIAQNAAAKKLAKTATAPANSTDPSYAIISVNGVKDTFPVSGWSDANRSYSLKKGTAYDFGANVYNSAGTCLNATGQSITGNVPNTDTFSVSVACHAMVANAEFSFLLAKGTKEAALVDSITVWIRNVTTGTSGFSDFLKTSFTPNPAKDTTITLSELLFLPNFRTPALANKFEITATANCTDGSLYSCMTNAEIYPSTPSSVTLTLIRYDPNGSLSKVTLVVNIVTTSRFNGVFQN